MGDYIPQIIMIVLYSINLITSATKHGEQKEESYNFWVTLLSTALSIWILKWGGFWK